MPATLWKPTLVALGAATALTAGWILLPTTVNETSAPAQELPTQAQTVLAQARAGDIEKVTVDAAAGTFTITRDDGTIDTLTVDTRQGPTVAVQLAAAGIDVAWPTVTPDWAAHTVERPSPLLEAVRWVVITGALITFTIAVITVFTQRRAGVRWRQQTHQAAHTDTRFGDVAGCDEAVAQLAELVDVLKHPDRYRAVGARPPRGALLVGPPGTGKTLLARAVAGEADAEFYAVNGSDFMERLVGVGAARIRDLFRQARKAERAIVFIDEIDAFAGKRGSNLLEGTGTEAEHTLIALLAELDGFQESNVVLIAATNRSELLDDALLRPGRLDRRIDVPLPDRRGRIDILHVHARNLTVDDNVDLAKVAARCTGFSGAQLEAVLNEAAIAAARDGRQRVNAGDVDRAVADVAMGRARHSAVITERDRNITAWHEAGHAACALLLEHAPDPIAVSIVPRGPAGGVTWMSGSDDHYLTVQAAHDRLTVALGGRAGEKLLLDGQYTQGASGDLNTAAHLAYQMTAKWAMTDSVTAIRPDTPGWDRTVAATVDRLVADAAERADRLVHDHRDLVAELAEQLLQHEDLNADDITAIVRRLRTGTPANTPVGAATRRAARAHPGKAAARPGRPRVKALAWASALLRGSGRDAHT